jgi:dihydroxy-acid dehydratase
VIKEGLERVPHRALLYATGLPKSEMRKPFIGVATSFTDIIPGHIGMRDLERFIEKGVHTGGGYPFFFGIPGICDGIAMGHSGMHYSLPSRELIADMVETVAQAHQLDGLVLLTNCDKITPGMLMAAARINIPSIVVTAGPMLSGHYKDRRLNLTSDTFEAVGKYKRGLIKDDELQALEMCACPGAGSCHGLYYRGDRHEPAEMCNRTRSLRQQAKNRLCKRKAGGGTGHEKRDAEEDHDQKGF